MSLTKVSVDADYGYGFCIWDPPGSVTKAENHHKAPHIGIACCLADEFHEISSHMKKQSVSFR